MIKVDAFFTGDKRAEVKAANPEYKIGDIGKVAPCSDFNLNIATKLSAGHRENVEGA